jgi:hypothetical protein
MAVIHRIGYEAGRLGDRLSLDVLRYNPVVIKKFDAMARADAPVLIGALRAQFPEVKRVIDVGAGSCAFAAEGVRQGIDVTAVERSRYGRSLGKRSGVRTAPFDLEAIPPARVRGPFDLAYCFEVAEHVPQSLGDRLVGFLCTLAPLVVFTAASPGQGGTGHINEQPASYWIERFGRRDYLADEFRLDTSGVSPHWAKTNRFVFRSNARDPAVPAGTLQPR